jgi:nicotinamide-nucleotide amidase
MREILVRQVADLLDYYRARNMLIATAESCTGGLLTAYLTHVAGASDVIERGFITYSNDSKRELLGVDQEMLDEFGAVSREVALSMAAGALLRSKATVALALTGLAGPGGGSDEKPVGLVHFAAAKRIAIIGGELKFTAVHHVENFGDIGRGEVREESVATALKLLRQAADL